MTLFITTLVCGFLAPMTGTGGRHNATRGGDRGELLLPTPLPMMMMRLEVPVSIALRITETLKPPNRGKVAQ